MKSRVQYLVAFILLVWAIVLIVGKFDGDHHTAQTQKVAVEKTQSVVPSGAKPEKSGGQTIKFQGLGFAVEDGVAPKQDKPNNPAQK